MTESTEALVLRRIPYGDSSLVLHLFAPDRGRVPALAKGAFRPKSPHFAALDLLNRIRAPILRRREGGLAVLGAPELLDEHRRLRTRLDAIGAALFAAELVDSALTEAPAPALYAHLLALLEALDAADASTASTSASLIAFELRFLDDVGLRPSLDACVECGVIEETWSRVSVAAGGVLCMRCAAASRDAMAVAPAALAAARALLDDGVPSAPLAAKDAAALRSVLDRFHSYHLDRVPRSRPSLERIGVA